MNLNLTRNTLCIQEYGNERMSRKDMREFYLKETKSFYVKFKDYIKTAGLKLWDDVL